MNSKQEKLFSSMYKKLISPRLNIVIFRYLRLMIRFTTF